MKISLSNRLLTTVAVLTAAGIGIPALGPAIGQDRPESLLPPGFGEPAPSAPQPSQPASPSQSAPSSGPSSGTPAPAPATAPSQPSGGTQALPAGDRVSGGEEQGEGAKPAEAEPPTAIEEYRFLQQYELPAFARRSLARVGASGPSSDGLGPDAFGRARGQFLETVMRRMDVPVASRWLSIGLRRALLSAVDTPRDVNGADFAAERAWLLIRMGEADAARALVQSVDIANYTPKMLQIAMQAALASGDPAMLCPMVVPAREALREPGWTLADAMCKSLNGEGREAGRIIDAATRRRQGSDRIDVLLAEKVVGVGSERRAVTIEWDDVERLTAWRYGLAMATGTDIPDGLIATAGPQLRYWRATSPMLSARARLPLAEAAAVQGVFSNAGLVGLYGEVEQEEEAGTAEVAIARDLRDAYVNPDPAPRVATLRRLWDEPRSTAGKRARLILTATAAARIDPDVRFAADAPDLIASMLSAGYDIPAMRWLGTADRGSDAWAMLMLADPAPRRMVGYGDFDAYRGNATERKAQMLFAGLAGLGRLDEGDVERLARGLEVSIDQGNAWTRAIEAAAARGEPGTVMVLAGTGMQTQSWQGVPPLALYHIVSALRRVGLEGYARMIAAEAVARL